MYEIKTKADAMRVTNELVKFLRACDDRDLVDDIQSYVTYGTGFDDYEIERAEEEEKEEEGLKKACNEA